GGAARRQLGRWRGRVEAAVAGPLVGDEGRDLPVKAEDRGGDDRLAQPHRGVVQQVTGGGGGSPGDHGGGVLDQVEDVAGVEAAVVLDHLDVGVEPFDEDPRRGGLRHPDPFGVVNNLALQVGGVDYVIVDEADRADPGGGEVERGRSAEAASSEQQHLRVQQLHLAVDADLGQEGVARVALALLGRHAVGGDDRQALLLPLHDAAAHRGDVFVAEPLHLRSGGGRAVAAAAVDDRAGRFVRRRGGDFVG